MPEELSDLVRKLGIDKQIPAGKNKERIEIYIIPYDESHADFFTETYSKDNEHLKYFVVKGWSPSIEEMKREHGKGKYRKSEEYQSARKQRHLNTLNRNSKDRYFFTILEGKNPIGYVSVVEKEEDGKKIGRVSVMIGYKEDCNKNSGSLALAKMLEVLAEKTDFEIYDGKVEEDNNPALRAMRKVFGEGIETRKSFVNTYKTLDGQQKEETVQRQYFERPKVFFLQKNLTI